MSESAGKVLVVEDDLGVRRLCARVLESMDFDVEVADSGDAGLALIGSGRYDMVLTDLLMPGKVQGASLVEEIQRISPSTEVVVMTGSPSIETAVHTLKHGATDYLLKPFLPEHLQLVVARSFEGRRLSRELDREKMMRQELEAAYAELQKVERLKDAILSTLSHELRTPLAVAISAAALIEQDGTSAERSQKLHGMLRSSLEREHEAVESLLLSARLRAGDLLLNMSAVDLRRTLEDLVLNFRLKCEERQLSVDVEVEDSARSIVADAGLVTTALKCLLLNAIQFNKKEGWIKVAARGTEDGVDISFSDGGIGIPEDKLPKIADGFYQAAEHLTREVGGLGLGLAIVRRVVEAHGGSISVSSREGEGSTFMVHLPKEGK